MVCLVSAVLKARHVQRFTLRFDSRIIDFARFDDLRIWEPLTDVDSADSKIGVT